VGSTEERFRAAMQLAYHCTYVSSIDTPGGR
jgi:hypothetical protein